MEILSGVGAIGITYHSCPYWRRRNGRPMLHISLWFIKVLIKMPWKDVTPKGKGSFVSSYGFFWWPSLSIKVRFYWEHK